MTTEVVTYQAMPLPERQNYAVQVAAAARMLPNGIRGTNPDETAAQAFLIMETGAMLGLHPIAALSSVNIIEGKPAMSADLMVSLARAAGHQVRITEDGTVEGGDYKATVTIIRNDDPDHPVSSTWTPHRAARAGLCTYEQQGNVWRVTSTSQNGAPLPWQRYTEALCKARAKSEAARDGVGDVLNGIRYTPEELGADVDALGNPIITSLGEVETVDQKPAPSALPPATKRATKGRQGARRKKAEPEAAPAAEEAQAPVADEKSAEVIEDAVLADEPTPQEEAPAPTAEDDERQARAAMAAEQERMVSERERVIATAEQVDRSDEAAVAAWNAEHGKATGHFITSDTERAAQAAKLAEPQASADDATQYVDKQTGDVYESQDALDAAIKARVEAKRAAREQEQAAGAPSAYDVATSEEPDNYERRARAASTEAELKAVWDDATKVGAMTADLGMLIVQRKGEVSSNA